MRKPLKPRDTITLYGESDGVLTAKTFQIVSVMKEDGASSITYEAMHDQSSRGVLKEFYPQSAYAYTRGADGHLQFRDGEPESERQRFRQESRRYEAPYRMLRQIKRQADHEEGLDTFLPIVEIYRGGADGQEDGGIYIWSPMPRSTTFADFCREVHDKPAEQPQHKLVQILSTMITLSQCVISLHNAELVHRDIKPSNFGFAQRRGEILTQAISLFDVDSICSVYDAPEEMVFSLGYTEPEAGECDPNNRTDVYSIGATLFHALIITEETKAGDYLYREDYYDRLGELVNESALMQASEANSHPALRDLLTKILRSSLARREERYPNCEGMLADLERAREYLMPAELVQKARSGENWSLAELEKTLDKDRDQNMTLSIQTHLFAHPLYECLGQDRQLRVAVLGFGSFGQKFLDQVLQLGQLKGRELQVSVFSRDRDYDRALYLRERPMLGTFFRLDDQWTDRGYEPYGTVRFHQLDLSESNYEENTAVLAQAMQTVLHGQMPHYVFVSLGNNGLSLHTARVWGQLRRESGQAGQISFVWSGEKLAPKTAAGLLPIYVQSHVRRSGSLTLLKRMAFNTHLIWEKNLNLDYSTLRKGFRDPYHMMSSMASAAAVKYKLYELGLTLTEENAFETARAFARRYRSDRPEDRKEIRDLVWMEHRRWVTEKLCTGWQLQDDRDLWAVGQINDKRTRRHICMLSSTPDPGLSAWKLSAWDTAPQAEVDKLDDLDRMSLELHRLYVQLAGKAKQANLRQGGQLASIRNMVGGHRQPAAALSEWQACIHDIESGDERRVNQYRSLKQDFLASLEGLPKGLCTSIANLANSHEAMFQPILKSLEYRDYKKIDETLVEMIPFILTYGDFHLVVPYACGSTDRLFANVAAATAVSPARLSWLCFLQRETDYREILDSLPYVSAYMKKKKFRAQTDLVLICRGACALPEQKAMEEEVRTASGGQVSAVRLLEADGIQAIGPAVRAYLQRRRTGKHLFALEMNETELSWILQGAGVYQDFDHYAFDSRTMTFRPAGNCHILQYISKQPYITVAEMAAFQRSSGNKRNPPEFFEEYENLWSLYKKDNGRNWKLFCGAVMSCAKKQDLLAEIPKRNPLKKGVPVTRLYRLPYLCAPAAEKIIKYLMQYKIAESGSAVYGRTTEACEVRIVDRSDLKKEYDQLFSRVHGLMLPDLIDCWLDGTSHSLKILSDRLEMENVEITLTGKPEVMENIRREVLNIAYQLEQMNLIAGLTADTTVANKIRFTFTCVTRSVKQLLTKAGEALEVYVYHKVKETGVFDDVAAGYEIDWEDPSVHNEFDCVVTRGFRSLFVECKAKTSIEQDTLFKLAGLAGRFGVNATAVLIADTREMAGSDLMYLNKVQRSRGRMLNVVTISDPNEIEHIGETLSAILDGTYLTKN